MCPQPICPWTNDASLGFVPDQCFPSHDHIQGVGNHTANLSQHNIGPPPQQGMDPYGEALSKGQNVQGTYRARDASYKGGIVQ
jgi:hypothetical protein